MDRDTLRLIDEALWRCREALQVNPWQANPQWLTEAIVTYVVVYLKDALILLAKENKRVDFMVDDTEDVTKRIADYRNFACHNGSPSRQLGEGVRVSFMVLGPGANAIGGVAKLKNPADDDVAYVYGKTILLHRSHLVRATEQAILKVREIAREMGLERVLLTADR
jgi:hypothetical protein